MARYRGPRARMCRRLEFPVFESEKFSSIRKNYPPGQHGQSRRRKLSNYGVQLREKQRIKYLYGILEKQFRNYFKKATCFKNPEKGWPEPLCTIYEPSSIKAFHQYLSLGIICPRKVLMNMPHELLVASSDLTLQNINTPEGYEEVKSKAKLKTFENEGNYQ